MGHKGLYNPTLLPTSPGSEMPMKQDDISILGSNPILNLMTTGIEFLKMVNSEILDNELLDSQ